MPNDPPPLAPIGEDTLILRETSVLSAPVRSELVMMHIESGHYYGLDDIGADIWRRLETPCKFSALIDGLAADYDAERAVIVDDVRKLLSLMATHNVVTFA